MVLFSQIARHDPGDAGSGQHPLRGGRGRGWTGARPVDLRSPTNQARRHRPGPAPPAGPGPQPGVPADLALRDSRLQTRGVYCVVLCTVYCSALCSAGVSGRGGGRLHLSVRAGLPGQAVSLLHCPPVLHCPGQVRVPHHRPAHPPHRLRAAGAPPHHRPTQPHLAGAAPQFTTRSLITFASPKIITRFGTHFKSPFLSGANTAEGGGAAVPRGKGASGGGALPRAAAGLARLRQPAGQHHVQLRAAGGRGAPLRIPPPHRPQPHTTGNE